MEMFDRLARTLEPRMWRCLLQDFSIVAPGNFLKYRRDSDERFMSLNDWPIWWNSGVGLVLITSKHPVKHLMIMETTKSILNVYFKLYERWNLMVNDNDKKLVEQH